MKIISLQQYKEKKFEQEYQQLAKDIDFLLETMLQQDIDAIEHHFNKEMQNGR